MKDTQKKVIVSEQLVYGKASDNAVIFNLADHFQETTYVSDIKIRVFANEDGLKKAIDEFAVRNKDLIMEQLTNGKNQVVIVYFRKRDRNHFTRCQFNIYRKNVE